MTQRKKPVETSLIATLDILGMSRMMKGAQQEALPELAQSLEAAFIEAKKTVSGHIAAIDAGSRNDLKIANFLKIRVFSDTIVVSCNFNRIMRTIPFISHLSCSEWHNMVLGFFICVKSLTLSLFRDGYPTRGCIASGQIITTRDFIIGKPFLESLEISKELNFAGVVLTPCAKILYDVSSEKFAELAKLSPSIEKHYVYNKCNKRKCYYCLNFLDFWADQYLIDYLPSLFSAHGKTITDDVQEKMNNTRKLLQAFLKSVKHNNE